MESSQVNSATHTVVVKKCLTLAFNCVVFLSAFLKLPLDELARLGVDVNQQYIAGTDAAASLRQAWTQRQAELKLVMDRQLKAADFMGDLAGHFVNSSVPDEDLLIHLEDLDQLLADIDNARDFHTIGKWPALSSLLPGLTHRSVAVQSKAVQCIGTAVKNDYDFQLWVLEVAGGQEAGGENRSVLEVLTAALHEATLRVSSADGRSAPQKEKDDLDELLRRVLYALSAASRGNLDVQSALSATTTSTETSGSGSGSAARPSFVDQLKICVESPELSVGVKRKCWHIVSDLLDEMVYIRHDVADEYAATKTLQEVAGGEGGGADVSAAELAESVLQILKTLRPMGLSFVTPGYEWLLLAEEVAGQIASTCTLGEVADKVEVQVQVEGDQQQSCVLRTGPQVRDVFAHVVKVKTVLRNEYGDELVVSSDSEALSRLRAVEGRYRAAVREFQDHPLMQDTLY